jgi:hypothetical protein
VTIALAPEALIVGHVEVPGSEGEVRIDCELYRKGMKEGQETWSPAGSFTTWANGEFRFSELQAGTYKLITHEQMDRDVMLQIPGAPMRSRSWWMRIAFGMGPVKRGRSCAGVPVAGGYVF